MSKAQLFKIKQAIADEQWEKALNLIEPSVSELQNNSQLNYFFVLSLYKTKHYLESLRYANDQYNFYISSLKTRKLYFSILLACQNFLDAYAFLENLKQVHGENVANFTSELADKEAEVRQQKVTLNQKLKKFYHLGDLSITASHDVLQESKQLPATEYFQAAQFIFLDPFVHPLIRATVLENVISLKLSQKIQFYWIDKQNHEVDLAKLTRILDNQIQRKFNKLLQQRLANQDPILLEGIVKDKNLYLSYVYPFADQVFKMPELWVNYWIDDYYGRAHANTLENQTISKWQKKFQTLTSELFEN